MSADMNVQIDFSTNAKLVEHQIKALNTQVKIAQVGQARLDAALRGNKASSKALTGDLRAKKSILKLDKQISGLAVKRMDAVTRGYTFANKGQERYVKGLIKTNEVMRIQRKIMDDNATAMVNMGKNTQWAGRQLVVGFTVPLTIAAGAAMAAFSGLEKEMIKFKRVYGDAFTTNDDLKEASKNVKDLAVEWTKYGVAVSETIDLAGQAAGAGFTGNQLTTQINSATKIAVLGELDKQKAMKATIALQSTFRMSNQELAQSINFLNQLENQTMVTMDDMTTAIPKAATIVNGLGGSIKDLGVFMSAMAEGGVTAAQSANALKSGLGSLLNPSKAARAELASIGVVMEDLWAQSEKNGEGIMFVVESLADSLERLGQTQKQMVMEELFGKHQFARMNALLSNINTGAQAQQAKGVAQTGQLEAALIAQRELGKLGESNLTKFQAAIERIKASVAPLGETLMGFVTPLLEGIGKTLEWFNKLPDVFKKIGLGMVAGLGIIAPLSLMLLGQIQNLLGQGMKFVNWIRHWGKETRWINTENLTLADTLSKVDAQLIAETTLLRQNSAAWGGRAAAATHSTAATAATIVTARRPRGGPSPAVTGMATGGSVGGTGNGDTVPALLTPGEFVVKKSVAEKFGNVLSAMNSGRLQGFSGGGTEIKPLGGQRVIAANKTRAVTDKVNSLSPAEAEALKSSKFASLMSYKNRESQVIRTFAQSAKAALPQLGMNPGDRRFYQWDSSHVSASNASRLKKMSDEEIYKSIYGATYERGNSKGWNYKSDIIQDNHLINTTLPGVSQHPISADAVKHVKDVALGRMKKNGITPHLYIAEKIADWRTKAGKIFYDKYLDDNFIHMNLVSNQQKGSERLDKLGYNTWAKTDFYDADPKKIHLPKGKWGGMEKPKGMATGGFVPGTGNEDTVPAMLTPGEAVVKKSAAQKFGGILNAMNSGKLRMFSQAGTVQAEGVGEDYGKAMGVAKLSIADRQKLMAPFFDAIDGIVDDMAREFKMNAKEMNDLRSTLTAEYTRDDATGEASHQYRAQDEAGNKYWAHANLGITPKLENNSFEQLRNPSNIGVLNESLMRQAKASNLTTEQILKRRNIIARVSAGEHLMEEAERKLLGEMLIETKQYQISNPGKSRKFTDALSRDVIPIAGGLTHANPRNMDTGQKYDSSTTKAAQAHAISKAKAASGKVDPEEVAKPGGGGAQKAMGVAMALTMITQFGGLSEKMGKFGDVLTQATTALFTMSMMGNMMPGVGGKMMGGLKGMKGASQLGGLAKGLGSKFSFNSKMLAPGGLVALLGGAAGNMIKDGESGTRDVAGNTAKYAAIGGGLGMMFGPFGAGLGAATGALAGFMIQTKANNEEMKKANEAIRMSTLAYSNMADQLEERYQLGGNSTSADLISGVANASEEQQELFEQLGEDMSAENGPWANRIKSLELLDKKGMYGGAENEINQLTMELRGRGVDEDSIEMILKAFVQELPEALRSGMVAANTSPVSTAQIVKDVDPANTVNAAGLLATSFASLNNQILNLDPTAKNYEKTLKKMTAQQEDAEKKLAETEASAESRIDFLKTVGATVTGLITSNQGQGLSHGEWINIQKGFHGNQAELTLAAEALILAGYDLSEWSAGQIIGYERSLEEMAKWQAKADKAQENSVEIAKDLETLRSAKSTRDKDEKKYAGLIAEQERGKALDIKAANLSIEQIDLEEGALAKFTAKFNKAFGTSIDSFADAQYQINKIGNEIQRINLKVIDPLQERVDDMSRKNELAGRRLDDLEKKKQKYIEELEEKKQKHIDKVNNAYDKQIDALEKIREQNEYIFDQQKNAVDMADALAKGDVAGAVNAMVESNRATADYTGTFAEKALQDQKDAALANEPEDPRIDKLQKQIDAQTKVIEARAERIEAIEDRIYRINEKQIEPLQRRSELMSYMLSTSQLQLENQKANVNGIDMENFAREQALQSARESLRAAQEQKTKQDEINETFRKQRRLIATNNDISLDGVVNVEEKLVDMHAMNQAAFVKATKEVESWGDIATAFGDGIVEGTEALQEKAKTNSVARAILEATGYLKDSAKDKDKDETDKKDAKTTPKQSTPKTGPLAPGNGSNYPVTSGTGQSQGEATGSYYLNWATGGDVPGTGGQDSVRAMLTPGEFVMRKSAVKRLGKSNLARLNQGEDIDKYAAGGEVKPNFLGVFGNKVISELADDMNIKNIDKKKDPTESGSIKPEYSGAAPSGKIGKIPKGSSGMSAERASWIKPSAVRMMRYVKKQFPWATGTTYQSSGEHGSGKAVDYWPSKDYRSAAGNAQGWSLANWARKNNEKLKVRNIIWDDKIWSKARQNEGWRNYSHFSGSTSDTNRHRDHAHILNFNKGGSVPGLGGIDTVPSMLTPGEFVLNKAAVNNIGTGPLRALNSGSLGAMSQFSASAPANTSVTEGDVVYNYDYNLSFEITEASDANEVANVVLNKINTATRSRVRSR